MISLGNLLITSPFLLLVGCAIGQATPQSLPLRQVAQGTQSQIEEPTFRAIRTLQEWEELWSRHVRDSPSPNRRPEVDFNREMVLAAFAGQKNTGGYSIEIVSAQTQSTRIIVRVEEGEPAEGAMTIQVLTSPFHIVAVPKSSLPVEFEMGN